MPNQSSWDWDEMLDGFGLWWVVGRKCTSCGVRKGRESIVALLVVRDLVERSGEG